MNRRLALLTTLTLGLGSLPAADVPRPAPELAFTLTNGKQALLTNYRGKVVALEFLLTTCPHCQKCSSIMEKMYKEFGSRGLQPIGVAINEDQLRSQQDLVKEYLGNLKLTYPVGYTKNAQAISFLQFPMMKRMLMPQLVLIDRTGVIRAQMAGDDPFFDESKEEANMRVLIEKILKPGAPAAKAAAKK